MSDMEMRDGRVWILPLGSDDLVPVTDEVVSFEHDGTLHLAESVGTVESVQLTDETGPGGPLSAPRAL